MSNPEWLAVGERPLIHRTIQAVAFEQLDPREAAQLLYERLHASAESTRAWTYEVWPVLTGTVFHQGDSFVALQCLARLVVELVAKASAASCPSPGSLQLSPGCERLVFVDDASATFCELLDNFMSGKCALYKADRQRLTSTPGGPDRDEIDKMPDAKAELEEHVQGHINMNAFAAICLRDFDPHDLPQPAQMAALGGMRRWALSNISEALELPTDNMNQIGQMAILTPGASMWFIVIARQIYSWCQRGLEADVKDGIVQDASEYIGSELYSGQRQWVGSTGFSVARWQLWKTRLLKIANIDSERALAVSRDLALRAARSMAEVDGSVG